MNNWNSTEKVLVQLRKLSRKKTYPVCLNEISETEWDASVTWDDETIYKFHPKYFEKIADNKLIFKLKYSEIVDQYFQKNTLREWANENPDIEHTKKAFFNVYHLVSKTDDIYKCEGKYSWPIFEAMKNLTK